MTNYQRTEGWLKACGKTRGNKQHLSTQIGVHIEETIEFFDTLDLTIADDEAVQFEGALATLRLLSKRIKSGQVAAGLGCRLLALDALCDSEVTGNGIAYLAGFDKDAADQEVLRSNDSKLEDGLPVILAGGKIGKGKYYSAPDLTNFI